MKKSDMFNIMLSKDGIGFEIDDGEIKRVCSNDKESFDEERGDLTEIFC